MKNKKNLQSWRTNKKKYYIKRQPQNTANRLKKRRLSHRAKRSRRAGFLSPRLKQRLISFGLILVIITLLSGLTFFAYLSRKVTDIRALTDRQLAESTKIFDRTGEELLFEIHGEEKRTEVSLAQIPDYVKWATIAIEDKNFYKHKGISIWGIFRGVVIETLRHGRAQGGSTLTQQFVKNAILTPERRITRKLKEWILAYRIEKTYAKDEILEFYFNEIPYGSTAYGIEAASQLYFGKSIRDINLAEAAILAALPQAPSKYSPYGSNRELLIGRQQYILDLMVAQKYISAEQAEKAKEVELDFKPPNINIKAPHFVMYVKEILSEKYGEKTVEQDGLKVITTLDLYKQEIAEGVISKHAEDNLEEWDATNAALISLDPKTGQVLAMVGSKGFFNEKIDGQVNITTSLRQPGSSMKPVVYATAFIKGYTPDTVLYDVVTNFSHDEAEPYEPHNYDLGERGPVTIRRALAGSLNIPAVKTIYLAGINNVLDVAEELGYTSLTNRDRFGLSLVLGGGEVKLIEHANAFSAFAREGLKQPISAILRVEDKDGKELEEYEEQEKKVIDPKVARLINNILSDNTARAYTFGESNWLTLGGRPVAAKTGTTNDYRDAWTIGYTPSLVTGVWVGNNDNAEMKRGAAGGVVAAPIWHDYMDRVLGDTPIEYFKEPEIKPTGKPILDGKIGAATVVRVDKASGLLATEYTPEHLVEERTYYEPHSILYYLDKNDPLGDPPSNPVSDPQFSLWEERVLKWAEKQLASSTAAGEITATEGQPPTESDNVHRPENIPVVKIITPGPNQTILEPTLNVQIQTTAPRGVNRAEYFINDNLFYANPSYPFNMSKRIDFLNNGFHNLKIRVCDDVDNCRERSIEFNLVLEERLKNQNISIGWAEAINGLAITRIDFPFTFKLKTNDPMGLAKANLFYTIESDNTPQFITSIAPIGSTEFMGVWDSPPPSGTYHVTGEGITWGKKSLSLEPITIIVNNPILEEDSTEE